MQRDFIRFAQACIERGHRVRVYTLRWEGNLHPDLELCLVPVRALSNHRRNRLFATWVAKDLEQNPVDGVVGFNKMPGLDVYFAADSCYRYKAEHERGWLYRHMPRYRQLAAAESAVFDAAASTHVLLISNTEKAKFLHYYQTPPERLHMLPPGIDPGSRLEGDRAEHAQALREEFGLGADARVLLFVGSGFIKKGLDRAIRTLCSLRESDTSATLLIAGQDRSKRFELLARRLGVAEHCLFLGGRDDIPALLAGADLLIHPALDEAAGIVLLEAVVAGLPVVVTDVCGYAHHVGRSGCGRVLSSPFSQAALDACVKELLDLDTLAPLSEAGVSYGSSEDLYSMHSTGAVLIESLLRQRRLNAPAEFAGD